MIGEDGRARRAAGSLAQQRLKVVAVEDVVAQDQRARLSADEVRPRMKACASPSGLGCTAVAEIQCPTGCRRRAGARSAACPAAWEITRMSRMPASISVVSG